MKRVISSEKGKQCDLYPYGSVHSDSAAIPSYFIVKQVDSILLKDCPYCKLAFAYDTPFVNSGQTGDEESCIRCHERRYVVGRESYKEAVIIEYLQSKQLISKE